MNGREEWAAFAEGLGIEWEVGPAAPRDQYGQEYYTFLGGEQYFKQHLERLHTRYVIVRSFPEPHGAFIRMRLSEYPQKPTGKSNYILSYSHGFAWFTWHRLKFPNYPNCPGIKDLARGCPCYYYCETDLI